MSEFFKAGELSDVPPGTSKRVEINANAIALFNLGGEIYAISDVCTHRECSLSEGFLEGDRVTCPCHLSVFEIKTGKVLEPPALTDVKAFKVRVEGNVIEVEV